MQGESRNGWFRQRKLLLTLLVACTLGVGIVVGTIISGRVVATRDHAATDATLLATPDPARLSSTFAEIVGRVEPAVVNISTTQVIERPRGDRNPRSQDPFEDFFDRFFSFPDQGPEAERSLGSGVIVDPKGFILTNNHVIDQATRIQVTLNGDPTRYTAKVIGADEETDLAVIKIETHHPLPIASLGNSSGVQVGDWVLAFGSPFGLQSTVTAGIVSAKDRGGVGHQFQHFIQTDAAINPGNSGGPLVNMAGQVIGINTAIYTGGRGFEGVGFALPSDTARSIYNQLIEHGRVTRGSIGITFQEDRSRNPVLLRELGAPYGIVIEGVAANSPAAHAGLKPGDVITSVDGHPVHSGSDLVNPIAQTPIGRSVRLGYVRERKAHEADLKVADRNQIFPQLNAEREQQPEQAPAQFGLRVEELTPEMGSRLGMPGQHGVIVSEVDPASFAEDVGFARGDVIVEINRVPVSGLSDYQREITSVKPGQDILFKVLRRGDTDTPLTLFLAGVVPEGK
jgi:serine protease Do